jgi:hypothetical protein
MVEIHCHTCGGFISEPNQISHRLPPGGDPRQFEAIPTSALCTCEPPIVYGAPEGRSSSADGLRLEQTNRK